MKLQSRSSPRGGARTGYIIEITEPFMCNLHSVGVNLDHCYQHKIAA
jgi:hypothetical protein